MQEKTTHALLTKTASYRPQNHATRNPTTDHDAVALIIAEYDIVVADAFNATTAAASLITVILRSWSHFRFRVARVPDLVFGHVGLSCGPRL